MAEIDRFDGNLRAFGADAINTERTVFGDVTQSDALDDNLNSDFFRGWGIVGPSENPTKQDFNAMGFTLGQLLAYLFQRGVAEWNVAQEYYAPAIVTHAGGLWLALSDNTGSEPPSADWARVDPGGLWKFTGVISPAQITSNQNNYNPTGLSGAFTVRLDADAARNITGLAGGEPGRVIELRNVSAFPITLVNESGSSSAANRFALGANAPLQPNRSALLIYDGALNRWRSIVAIDDLANYLPLAGGVTVTGPVVFERGSDNTIIVRDTRNTDNTVVSPIRLESGDGSGNDITFRFVLDGANGLKRFDINFTSGGSAFLFNRDGRLTLGADGSGSTDAVTKQQMDAALLGWGQTWQDVTGSRAANTAYQNTTGKPICVSVFVGAIGATRALEVSTDNSTWGDVANTTTGGGTMQAIVPPGHYYRMNGSFGLWRELR